MHEICPRRISVSLAQSAKQQQREPAMWTRPRRLPLALRNLQEISKKSPRNLSWFTPPSPSIVLSRAVTHAGGVRMPTRRHGWPSSNPVPSRRYTKGAYKQHKQRRMFPTYLADGLTRAAPELEFAERVLVVNKRGFFLPTRGRGRGAAALLRRHKVPLAARAIVWTKSEGGS